MLERVTIDPVSEDAAGEPLDLIWQGLDQALALTGHDYPAPTPTVTWAAGPDQDGDTRAGVRYGNRQISLSVEALAVPTTPAAVNLITNPRCRTSSGFTASSATLYSGDDGYTDLSGNVTGPCEEANIDSILVVQATASVGGAYHTATVSSGQQYTFSAWIRSRFGHTIKLSVWNAGGTVKAQSAAYTTNAWTRVSVTFTADSTGSWRFGLEVSGSSNVGAITGLQLETGDTATPYLDGYSPGCSWSGSRDASTSTRPTGSERVRRAVDQVARKLAKVTRRGGTLRRVFADGTVRTYELRAHDQLASSNDAVYYLANLSTITAQLTAAPFWRGQQVTRSLHSETSLPALVFSETALEGDAPALGVLRVDEGQGVDQAWVTVGMQTDYDPATSLFLQAEALTPLGGAATSTTPTGGSGSGSNVVKHTSIGLAWQAFLSTQATGGGAHLTHTGTFRVWARVQTPAAAGVVSVALEWGVGDLRRTTQQGETELPATGVWRLVDLGLVTIPEGTTQWEARLLAKSTVVGDDIACDYLLLQPVDFWCQVAAATVERAPTAYTALDDFRSGTYAGDLAGDTLPVGGTWGSPTAGGSPSHPDADDFTVPGGASAGYLTRSAASDAAGSYRYGRIVTASATSSMSATAARVTVFPSLAGGGSVVNRQGVVARVVDRDNMLGAYYRADNGYAWVVKSIAGVDTVIGSANVGAALGVLILELVVLADGRWILRGSQSERLAQLAAGQDPDLAAAGALQAGSAGIMDHYESASAFLRSYGDFRAWVPTSDAAVRASRTLRIKHDLAERQDTTGAFYSDVSSYIGDRLLIEPGVPLRFLVKACRADPTLGGIDTHIDDIHALLQYTPRGLL